MNAGKRLVEERAEQVLELGEVVLVRVPAGVDAVDLRFVLPVDRDQRHARLDQPPGHQQALADGRLAVALADGRRLALQVEHFAGLVLQQRPDAAAVGVEHRRPRPSRARRRGRSRCPSRSRRCACAPRARRRRACRPVDLEVGAAEVALDEEGVVLLAHAAAGLAGDPLGLAGELQIPRQHDRRRQPARGRGRSASTRR